MFQFLKSIIVHPAAHQLAHKQLDQAKIDLLYAEMQLESSQATVDILKWRIARLTDYLGARGATIASFTKK